MAFNSSAIIILIVVAFAFYLIYSQNSGPKYYPLQQQPQISHFKNGSQPSVPCEKCEMFKQKLSEKQNTGSSGIPQINSILIENDSDPYSDPIKKQDLYGMYDHLTYPQMRLPREVLEKYNEYYERNGSYPPFGQSTQPLFDNPILNGFLIKQLDDNEPFSDVTAPVPLFRVKSAKNTNRFFYYIIDQRSMSKLELKIPLDHIKINSIRHHNSDFYGLPELYDGDIIENIAIYPGTKFKVTLYKTYHFP